MTFFSFTLSTAVRGYHVYQDNWEPDIGDQLHCEREPGNSHDTFAVAVKNDTAVVGHVPRLISSICSVYIRRGGSINCTITGSRRYSADLPQGGMEIPCVLTFKSSSHKECDKAVKLLNMTLYKNKDDSDKAGHDGVSDITPSVTIQSDPEAPPELQSCPVENHCIDPIKAEKVIEMLSDTDDEEPSTKKLKLSIDLELIIMGEMLTDLEINFAQKILKSQFPEIHGLHLTLLQSKINENKGPSNDKLQIVHCKERHHWITVTTIGCDEGIVKVFDSVYCTLDDSSTTIILNMFQNKTKQPLKIKVIRPQKQIGEKDCGMFAIAFATSLAFDHKAARLKYDQNKMRRHLANCFEGKKLTVFPK